MARPTKKKTGRKSENANLVSAAAYFLMPVSSLAVYLLENKDAYVRFHALQSLFLGVLILATGWFLSSIQLVVTAVSAVALVLWLVMMWKAYNGEKYELPVIGEAAAKNA
jgi:uncharacterized membrane protein